MDNGGMTHHGHDMDMSDGCTVRESDVYPMKAQDDQMRMLFNADTSSTCVLHPWFRIHSPTTLLLNCLFTFALALVYERSRLAAQHYDRRLRTAYLQIQRSRSSPPPTTESDSLLAYPTKSMPLDSFARLTRAAIYALNVGVSFVLMLIVMTFNIYLIASVLLGAFVGHFLEHSHLTLVDVADDKGMACH